MLGNRPARLLLLLASLMVQLSLAGCTGCTSNRRDGSDDAREAGEPPPPQPTPWPQPEAAAGRSDSWSLERRFPADRSCVEQLDSAILVWSGQKGLHLTGQSEPNRLARFVVRNDHFVEIFCTYASGEMEIHVGVVAPKKSSEAASAFASEYDLANLYRQLTEVAKTCKPPEECDFRCGDGRCIASDHVCNRIKECADGSDEEPSVCERPVSCCVDTRGCQGETGSGCGRTCCCCPGGAMCCKNPERGCCYDDGRGDRLFPTSPSFDGRWEQERRRVR